VEVLLEKSRLSGGKAEEVEVEDRPPPPVDLNQDEARALPSLGDAESFQDSPGQDRLPRSQGPLEGEEEIPFRQLSQPAAQGLRLLRVAGL